MPVTELQAPPSTAAATAPLPPATTSAAAAAAALARLVVPRHDALRVLKAQIEKGLEIKRQRLRYVSDLERARSAKGDWTTATMTLLKGLFDTAAVADECQNWVGKVLPEYADLNLFIEHFYDEMDQRIRRLHAVWKRVGELPDDAARTVTQPSAGIAVQAPPPPPNQQVSARSAANPDFFDTPAASRAAAHASSATMRTRAGALVAYGPDDGARVDIRDFSKKLGYDLTEIAAAPAPSPQASVAAQLDAHPNLDFALILTRASADAPRPFELGYVVGRVGLRRVFLLDPGAEKPTVDDHGLLHIPLDPADGWQLHLARQFKRAGLEVDLNRVF
jgi:hypothetical protein